jgi:hypothetical protein
MRNFKLTLVGLTLLSGLSCTNPLKAMTLVADSKRDFKPEQGHNGWYYGYNNSNGFKSDLQLPWGEFNTTGGIFNGQSSSQTMVRRWVSDFEGNVKFKIDFSGTNSPDSKTDFLQQILIDGKSVLSETSKNFMSKSSYGFGNFEVQKNSVIDFAFTPVAQNWQGQFNLAIEIEGEQSPKSSQNPKKPIDSQPIPFSQQSGLIFLKSSGGEPVHVGLLVGNTVYEANPELGVVQKQPFDQFIQDTKNYEVKEIPARIANQMAAQIETKLGAGYWKSPTGEKPYPFEQKGYGNNHSFTNIGLIEWAAEKAGVLVDQGFIPNYLELIETFLPSALEINNFYRTISLFSSNVTFRDFPYGGTLSANFSEFYEKVDSSPESQQWLLGKIESADFIVTDPLGRRMGYISGLGFFNEIPDVVYHSQNLTLLQDIPFSSGLLTMNPDTKSTFTTSGKLVPDRLNDPADCLPSPSRNNATNPTPGGVFQFIIDRRLPGEYKIEERTPTNCATTQTVPEPSAIASLLTIGLALKMLKPRK